MIKNCVYAVVVLTSPTFLINGLGVNFLDREFDVRIVSANGKENCLILRDTLVESAFMLQSYVNMDVVNTTIVIHYQSMNRPNRPLHVIIESSQTNKTKLTELEVKYHELLSKYNSLVEKHKMEIQDNNEHQKFSKMEQELSVLQGIKLLRNA